MNNFTASNGVEIQVADGYLQAYMYLPEPTQLVNPQIHATAGPEGMDALREFFRAEEEERIGRWRESDAEEWRVIPGYEGYYEVSCEGRVRSVERVLPDGRKRAGKILRLCTTKGNGRLKVSLSRDGVAASVKVHQLVARAFLGQAPDGKHMVLHSDGNHLNNHASNLRWGNNSDNVRDSISHGTWRNQHTRHAHPEPKPWHRALPGESWVLVYLNEEVPAVASSGESGHIIFTASTNEGGGTEEFVTYSKHITAGRRIFPEVTE